MICPAGSAYAGLAACDSSRNGAYTVAGQFLKTYTESCKTCSAGVREKLRLVYIDSFSRVLMQMPITKTHSPEDIKTMLQLCEKMANHHWKIPKDCPIFQAEQDSIDAHRAPSRTTLEWDDAPEGDVGSSSSNVLPLRNSLAKIDS